MLDTGDRPGIMCTTCVCVRACVRVGGYARVRGREPVRSVLLLLSLLPTTFHYCLVYCLRVDPSAKEENVECARQHQCKAYMYIDRKIDR